MTDRTDVLAVGVDALWTVLDDVAAYPTFWPWLVDFDGRRLRTGETWKGVIEVAGPLRLTVQIRLTEVDPGRCVAADLAGDLSGTARLAIAPTVGGCSLRLDAALVPERADLRALTRWARPVAQASHDRVIARALAQLATHVDS